MQEEKEEDDDDVGRMACPFVGLGYSTRCSRIETHRSSERRLLGVPFLSASTQQPDATASHDESSSECHSIQQQDCNDNQTIATTDDGKTQITTGPSPAAVSQSSEATTNNEQTTVHDDTDLVALGRAKALQVLAQFQKQSSTAIAPTRSFATADNTTAPSEVRRKRQRGFEREHERKRVAFHRNVEYLQAKKEQQIVLLNQQAAQAAVLEQQAQLQYQHHMDERRHKLLGIAVPHQKTYTTAAVYITGLGGGADCCQEAFLRQIFGVYGSVSKVHLYKHKQTGEFKGDGLIVYQIEKAQEETSSALIQQVCGQLNGAELADGSLLRVEPARSQKQAAASEQMRDKGDRLAAIPPTATTEIEKIDLPPDTSEELDAFFQSL